MSDSTLRSQLIRLAHAKPELRADLLPLLTPKQSSTSRDEHSERIYIFHFAKFELETNPTLGFVRDLSDPIYKATSWVTGKDGDRFYRWVVDNHRWLDDRSRTYTEVMEALDKERIPYTTKGGRKSR